MEIISKVQRTNLDGKVRQANKPMHTRQADRGALKFTKVNTREETTEYQWLKYIIQNSQRGNLNEIIKSADYFCWNKHWMMLVGDEKGKILDKSVKEHKPKYILEIGTYTGYSAARMARATPNSIIYTIEPSKHNSDIAEQLFDHAELTNRIKILKGYSHDVIPTLKNILPNNLKFDLVFIDHVKQSYGPDLQRLIKHNLVKSGTCLVADNVVIFEDGVRDYLSFVRNKDNCISSILYPSKLEYNSKQIDEKVYNDGIEVSILK